LLLGVILYLSWGCATRAHLIKDEIPTEVPSAICRRIAAAALRSNLDLLGLMVLAFSTASSGFSFYR
jgi:hypothetical protein